MIDPDGFELPDEDYSPPKIPFRWADLPRETCNPGGYSTLHAFCRKTYVLSSGRTIRLDSIDQFRTYGGVLAGLPDGERSHTTHVEWALDAAAVRFNVKRDKVLVLAPVILRSKIKKIGKSGELKEFDVEFLPPVSTAALFCSAAIDENNGMDSSLVIVWFQKAFGPPTEDSVLEAIRNVPWEERAQDREW